MLSITRRAISHGRGINVNLRIFLLQTNNNNVSPYHGLLVRYISDEKRAKMEETIMMLKADIARKQEEKKAKSLAVSTVKPPLMTRIKDEIKHYYHGFRLLALETRISLRYLWRMGKGETLLRKEKQQLSRTVADLFRLVPFSVFIIVPFMELALPIFIKLFPNMLPSTFQEASKEREKYRKQAEMKSEMAKFLQSTLEEVGLAKQKKTDGKAVASLEFANFIKKVREGDGYVSNEDIFKYLKCFEDEITLDNLAMSQLRALCRLLGIQPIGSPEILRFQLKMKLKELQSDDKLIIAEGGVDALSDIDVQQACRARGMRALGVSETRLRRQLKQWLDLSLNSKIPPTMLLLSRALYFPEHMNFTRRMKILLNELPKEVADDMAQKMTEIEGGKVKYEQRLELIKKLEETIKNEKIFEEDAKKKKQQDEAKKIEEELEKKE
uniref:Letm1 RBD domain-containing protein n=1 Tax=Parastrongyloides trichosuri TaxID=131310 RepID=A0A0N4ZM44_PARTI